MTNAQERAKVLAERLKKFLTWTGWHSTANEPREYPATHYSTAPLDERNTVVQIIATALAQVEAETWEQAAVIVEEHASDVWFDHMQTAYASAAKSLRQQAQRAKEGSCQQQKT